MTEASDPALTGPILYISSMCSHSMQCLGMKASYSIIAYVCCLLQRAGNLNLLILLSRFH